MSEKEKNSQKSIEQSFNQNGLDSNSDDITNITEWIKNLTDKEKRVNALVELSKRRDSFPELALYLLYTPGVLSALLQEILETYKLLAPPTLSLTQSNHTCNVLALFQCIAAHPETRTHFLSAQIPIFLYPFLNTLNKNRPFEYLRLTALGVIGALVKVDNNDVINFLLSTEIIPLCLRIMERGSELSKTVATFIVQRILLDDNGLNYVCNTAERFYAVSSVLNSMMNGNPTSRLIKHIIRCYARLSENPRVNQILKENMPQAFKDMNFINSLDESSKRWLQSLSRSLSNIESQSVSNSYMGSKQLNFDNLSSGAASKNMGNAANLPSNANYVMNSSNKINNNLMGINNMPAVNQIYDGYFYNPAINNLNGFIPATDQNGSNIYYGNNNYYVPPMAKMYPNSMGNGPYGVNSMNQAVNAGNGTYSNIDKKL